MNYLHIYQQHHITKKIYKMQRRKIPKIQNSVSLTHTKDNNTYISLFPLQRSQAYLNHHKQLYRMSTQPQLLQYNDQEIVDNFRGMISNQKIQKNNINKYVASVTTKKIGQYRFSNEGMDSMKFLEEYRLENGDLLQVCENKTFLLKNYFNYLHNNQVQKAAQKIQARNKHLQEQFNKYKIQHSANQLMKLEKVSMFGRTKNQEQILDPKHIKFQERVNSFNPKEKQRMEMSKRAQQANKGWYY